MCLGFKNHPHSGNYFQYILSPCVCVLINMYIYIYIHIIIFTFVYLLAAVFIHIGIWSLGANNQSQPPDQLSNSSFLGCTPGSGFQVTWEFPKTVGPN